MRSSGIVILCLCLLLSLFLSLIYHPILEVLPGSDELVGLHPIALVAATSSLQRWPDRTFYSLILFRFYFKTSIDMIRYASYRQKPSEVIIG